MYLEFFWSVFSRIWIEYEDLRSKSSYSKSECGKIRTRKTPNMDTFHAVKCLNFNSKFAGNLSLCHTLTFLRIPLRYYTPTFLYPYHHFLPETPNTSTLSNVQAYLFLINARYISSWNFSVM